MRLALPAKIEASREALREFRDALAPALDRIRDILSKASIFEPLRADQAVYEELVGDLSTIKASGCSRTRLCKFYQGKEGETPRRSSSSLDAASRDDITSALFCIMPTGHEDWVSFE